MRLHAHTGIAVSLIFNLHTTNETLILHLMPYAWHCHSRQGTDLYTANVSARAQEPVKKQAEPTHQNNTPNKKKNNQDAEPQKHNTQQHNGDSTNNAHRSYEQPHHEQARHEPSSEHETEQPEVVDTRKKVMRRSYKVNGYRVQVFAGGNTRNDSIRTLLLATMDMPYGQLPHIRGGKRYTASGAEDGIQASLHR